MGMTKREYAIKDMIFHILLSQGYKTYARLFDLFDINLTDRPNFVAAVDINRARILLKNGIQKDDLSTIVRHEILHRWLEHAIRLEKHIGEDEFKKISKKNWNLSNIAGDYEISNRGYTDNDKNIVRNLKINGIPMSGLVTELDHPEWTNLTFEEMYDRLVEESKKKEEEALENLKNSIDKDEDSDNDSNSNDSSNNSDNGSSESKDRGRRGNSNQKYSQAYKEGWKKAIEDYKAGKLKL